MKKIIATNDAPKALGPYSQAVSLGIENLVFTAGQLGIDPGTGNFVEGGIKEQTRQALKNIQAVLRAAGSEIDYVLKTTVFLKDMNDFAAMNEVYAGYFKTAAPARSAVQVAQLPKDGLIEIEAIALVLNE